MTLAAFKNTDELSCRMLSTWIAWCILMFWVRGYACLARTPRKWVKSCMISKIHGISRFSCWRGQPSSCNLGGFPRQLADTFQGDIRTWCKSWVSPSCPLLNLLSIARSCLSKISIEFVCCLSLISIISSIYLRQDTFMKKRGCVNEYTA